MDHSQSEVKQSQLSLGLLLISIENYCKGCLFAIHVNRLNHYFPLIFLFLIFVFPNGLPCDMKIFRIGNFLYVLGKFFVSTFLLVERYFFRESMTLWNFPQNSKRDELVDIQCRINVNLEDKVILP